MSKSEALFKQAQKFIPGGVNSPVRAFKSVGGTPPFIERAEGSHLYDVDGKRYIDYVGSWGPMIAGHAHPDVVEAIQLAASRGLSYGAPTEIEVLMAMRLCEIMPSLEMVRMVNSGTEATMSAIRLARGYTGRDKIVKFEGAYHGHGDSLLVKAGSGALTFGEPNSPGVPASLAEHTLTLEYNNTDQIREVFAEIGDQIACIIVEPVAGNMNCIPPAEGFLQRLREVCDRHDSVLIFDEVMTGFRVDLGGAQKLYSIRPDLTTLGKIVGGGMPVAAFGGSRKIMEKLSPSGPVYQAGTLSGNPIGMAAGMAMLDIVTQTGFYSELTKKTTEFLEGMQAVADHNGIKMTTNQVGGMFGLFFTDAEKVESYAQATACNTEIFKGFFHGMLERGIYFAPSAFESGFLSSAHTDEDIQATVQAANEVFATL